MTGRAFVLLLLFAATAASAQSEGYRSEEGAAKLCAREANWKPVPEATPTEVDRKEFAGVSYCAGWIYRLAGDEYDVVKARRCCLVSGTCNRELGMIFANGWGVRRDYDAAMSFLCRAGSEMAPAEQWGMLDHVEKMRLGETTDELQYCDHVTSGHGGLFCQQVEQARQSAAEKVKIEAVKTSLNREAQAKLTPLLEAVAKFGEAEGARTAEDSRGGTIYPSLVVAGTRTVDAAFVKALEARVKARGPKTSAASYAAADRRLNVAYQKLMKASGACPTCREDGGNAARAVVREAQRTWIAYRDAWAAFYAARWNGAAPAEALEREIKTLLTRERIKVLETSAE